MDSKILIQRILSSKSCVDLFPNLSNYSTDYREYVKVIHPDKCSDPEAPAAFDKLTQYKDFIENGIKFTDDAGDAKYYPDRIEFSGKEELLNLSLANYKTLISKKDDWSVKMRIYLPKSGEIKDGKLIFTLWEYGVPMHALGTLPHDHVNWITNRMFYFVDWLCSVGFSHNGINPKSFTVLPQNHGLVCISFYHLRPINSSISTISAEFQCFYPANVFKNKLSTPQTDIELVKKTAIWLLGDKSGVGIRLKKTHNKEVIDFLTRHDIDPYKAIDYHKELIKKLFPKQFVTLEA